jgi:hypothetical protein
MKGRKTGYLYLLSTAVLALLVWSTILSVRQPDIGVFWEYSTGIVYQVDAFDPSASSSEGDRIISSEGHLPGELYRQIAGQAGKPFHWWISAMGKFRHFKCPC